MAKRELIIGALAVPIILIVGLTGFSSLNACFWPCCKSKPERVAQAEGARDFERFQAQSRVRAVLAMSRRSSSMEAIAPSFKSPVPSVSGYTDRESHLGPREDSLEARKGASSPVEQKTPTSELVGPDLSVVERSVGPHQSEMMGVQEAEV